MDKALKPDQIPDFSLKPINGEPFVNRIKVKVYSKYLHISIESLKGAAYFVKLNKGLNFMNNSAMVKFYSSSRQLAVKRTIGLRLLPP